MHTRHSSQHPTRHGAPVPFARRAWASALAVSLTIGPWASMPAHASAPSNAPQILLTVTNSESMDGTTAGAIMTGSGSLGNSNAGLTSSSSPTAYTPPSGFTPPLALNADGTAPYTVSCGSNLCDNSSSRMNLTKIALKQVLSTYGDFVNFGLYAYKTGSPTVYTTWQYLMSQSGGFKFTNTASTSTVPNPCYSYGIAGSTVKSNCQSIAGHYSSYHSPDIGGYKYMTVATTSDDPTVNDVLYAGGSLPSLFVDYGAVSPSTPYPPNKTLANYNAGQVSETYPSVVPSGGARQTSPTNAGYVPYSTEVMYSLRGFGYGATQDATTGAKVVDMTGNISNFNTALAPETNNASTGELKSVAGQSAIGGLLTGALSYLNGLSKQNCQNQYVVLLTDGLPTMDKSGHPYPPLGSTSGNNYGVAATFNADNSLSTTYDSKNNNDQAVIDAIVAIQNLAKAGIKTYVIGLGAGVDPSVNPMASKTLLAMAVAGQTGNYFPANDPAALNAAFNTIVYQIYKESSVAAPIAPISLQGGNSLVYDLTTDPAPMAGHAKAYAVDATGLPSGTASWDAASQMNAANRTSSLMSTDSSGSVKLLNDLVTTDPGAFSLTVTTCVPSVGTIFNYTVNPSYTQSGCNYLGDRQPGWFLGTFSTQNMGTYVGPPSNPLLVVNSAYVTYARANQRKPVLMFSNNDGFIYSVDASTGALQWGWTPRSVLPKLQQYSAFPSMHVLDGSFAVVDARDASGNWGSYLIGSAQSGAEHFSVKLTNNASNYAVPSAVVYDNVVSGGTAAGDLGQPTGTAPLHQYPQVAYVRTSSNVTSYFVYTVNSGSTSTLYEVNIGTGAVTSASLPVAPSSALKLDTQNNVLWMGTSAGEVWRVPVSGNAATDEAAMAKVVSTVSPADNKTLVKPVLYVMYTEVAGVPYLAAVNSQMVTVFSIGTTGWQPVWASTTTSGYAYNTSQSKFVASSAIVPLSTTGVVSDAPQMDGKTLMLPVWVPPSGCGLGSAYIDFMNFTDGKLAPPVTFEGTTYTTAIYIGAGAAFDESAAYTSQGLTGYVGAQGKTQPEQIPRSNNVLYTPTNFRSGAVQ
jgi:type IV pilus assembly protein PilY1